MFAQAAWVTLLILTFRAGPQDFPFAAPLARVIPALTLAIAYLQFIYTLTPMQALLEALVSVVVIMGFSHFALRARALSSRYQQTSNALLATTAALTLAGLPAVAWLAPTFREVAKNPELAETVRLPALPTLIVVALSVWNVAVGAHILRQALEIRPVAAVGLALMLSLVMIALASAAGAAVG